MGAAGDPRDGLDLIKNLGGKKRPQNCPAGGFQKFPTPCPGGGGGVAEKYDVESCTAYVGSFFTQ